MTIQADGILKIRKGWKPLPINHTAEIGANGIYKEKVQRTQAVDIERGARRRAIEERQLQRELDRANEFWN